MTDKLKLIDNPQNWRIRNKVEVPEEYLKILRQNNRKIYVLIACLCVWCFYYGTLF